MRQRSRSFAGVLLLVFLPGCASAAATRSAETGAPKHSTARTVLHAEQLQGAAGNLLTALRARMLGLRVKSSASPCPEITLRGTKSMFGSSSPAIYVDGTRASNTCILDALVLSEVARVEVYPMGVAPSPPYKAHPNGLILVFLERGGP